MDLSKYFETKCIPDQPHKCELILIRSHDKLIVQKDFIEQVEQKTITPEEVVTCYEYFMIIPPYSQTFKSIGGYINSHFPDLLTVRHKFEHICDVMTMLMKHNHTTCDQQINAQLRSAILLEYAKRSNNDFTQLIYDIVSSIPLDNSRKQSKDLWMVAASWFVMDYMNLLQAVRTGMKSEAATISYQIRYNALKQRIDLLDEALWPFFVKYAARVYDMISNATRTVIYESITHDAK